jgi:hypothetical protein
VEKGTINHRNSVADAHSAPGRREATAGGIFMIRSALRLCGGIIAALCFACTPAQPNSDISPLTVAAAAPSPPACAFSHIAMVSATFNPANANGTPVPAGSIPAYAQSDLTAAFNLAPAFFQKQLCGLDGIFIAPTGDSWGFRNITDGRRYLALSMSLWKGGTAPGFSAYENGVVHRLLKGWTGLNHPGNPSDTTAVTVLAALAHEYGHILFYDTFVNPRGSAPKYGAFCGGNFYGDSWQSLPNEPNIWRSYGDIVGTHKTDDVQVQEILNAVPQHGGPDSHGAGALLRRLYGLNGTNAPIGRWASFFASFSPDEDFVETFKLFVLKNSSAPLRSFKINIPIANVIITEDIPGTCNQRSVLVKKLGCFAQAMCSGPTTDPCGVVCPTSH